LRKIAIFNLFLLL